MSTCQQCGAASRAGAAFCDACGASLRAATPPPAEAAPVDAPLAAAASDARNIALLAHLSAFVLFIGVPSFIGPLVVWLWQRNNDPFAAAHAREALNFNLSVLLYGLVGAGVGLLFAVVTLGIGIILLAPIVLALGIAFLVLIVIAAAHASRGEAYRYPVTIRFVQ